MRIYCIECGKQKEVNSFGEDKFILSCGHEAPDENELVRDLSDRIEMSIEEEANHCGHSVSTQRKILSSGLKKLSTAFCVICGKNVSTFRDNQGILRCGGDLNSDPGCGCIVSHSHKVNKNI